MGSTVTLVRTLATAAGGFLAGIGGSFLSLYYPGSWSEGLSSGQGLMAGLELRHAEGAPAARESLWAVKELLARGVVVLPEGEFGEGEISLETVEAPPRERFNATRILTLAGRVDRSGHASILGNTILAIECEGTEGGGRGTQA